MRGGETEGRRRLAAFLRGPVKRYGANRGALEDGSSSRLSPYLHFGCVSPREVEERLPRGKGAEAFRRQLAWRDFYHHVIEAFPRNAHEEFQERYRGTLEWDGDERRSRRGARAAPATRSWTPGCGSCSARAGCTTARGSWWRRSSRRSWAWTGAAASASSCAG